MDVLILIIVVVLGLVFANRFSNTLNNKEMSNLRILWFYHLIYGLYVYIFIVTDAVGYWTKSKTISWEEFMHSLLNDKGTYFMFAVHYFPSNYLDLSYFSGTIIYSLIGFIGLTYFYVLTIKLVPYNSKLNKIKLFPLLFFLPNLHFWSVTAGKDTLSFFAIAAFSYGLYHKKYLLVVLGLLLTYAVRPHVALFMVLAFGFAFLFGKDISKFKKLVFSILFLGVGIAILPVVLEYVKIEEISIEELSQFAENKATVLNRAHTGSGVDISGYPLPLKIFTFLYRPLFFDINGIPAVLASFENLLLLLLTFKILMSKPIKSFKAAPFVIKGFVIFLIIGTLAFSQTLGNLGIMLRMRNMFLPGMIIFLLWSMSYNKVLISKLRKK